MVQSLGQPPTVATSELVSGDYSTHLESFEERVRGAALALLERRFERFEARRFRPFAWLRYRLFLHRAKRLGRCG